MLSNWMVRTAEVAGVTFYRVYRLLDKDADDTPKNRVSRGGLWETRAEAERLARKLNEEAKNE